MSFRKWEKLMAPRTLKTVLFAWLGGVTTAVDVCFIMALSAQAVAQLDVIRSERQALNAAIK